MMFLVSILASALVVGVAGIKPVAMQCSPDGAVLLSVQEEALEGGQEVRTYRFSWPDGDVSLFSEEMLAPAIALPRSVRDIKVPCKLDSLVCAPQPFYGPDGELCVAIPGFRTGFCYKAVSRDGGKSWELPRRMLHNPDKPFSVCQLPGGDILLVKNCRPDEVEFTKDDELFALWSHDGGKSWYRNLKISGEKFCDSPVCCVDAQGNIYIAYRHCYQGVCDIKMVRLGTDGSRRRRMLMTAEASREAYLARMGQLLTPRENWLEDTLRICSYNTLRSSFTGGENWKDRCQTILEHIELWEPDVIGMQETSRDDIRDLYKKLKKNFDYIAITPEIMGPSVTRFRATSELPLWWNKKRFSLVEKGWLEFNIINPVKCGVNVSDESWGNGQDGNKAAIWAILLDKKNGKEICLFNLHLPTRSDPAKLATAKMLAHEVERVAGDRPVFITGDFNTDERSLAYYYLELDVEFLRDGGVALPKEKRRNWEYASMGGNKPMKEKTRNSRHIDHIFYTPASARPLSWEVNLDWGSNGYWGSDHHPLLMKFQYGY